MLVNGKLTVNKMYIKFYKVLIRHNSRLLSHNCLCLKELCRFMKKLFSKIMRHISYRKQGYQNLVTYLHN